MRSRSFFCLSAVIFMAVIQQGCPFTQRQNDIQNRNTSPPPPVIQKTARAGDFFPLTAGSIWSYQGEGNEYASFTRKVLFTEGNRAQIEESNGGTVLAVIYEVTNSAVRRIFRREEAYEAANLLKEKPTESVTILSAPFRVGKAWTSGGTRYEITDVNATLTVPAGTFSGCLVIKNSNPSAREQSVVREYYKEGIGLVKREFVSGETRVTSSLEKYDIQPAGGK